MIRYRVTTTKKADNRHAQSKISYKVDLYHIPHRRGRRHRLHTQKLPTRPYEARKRHGHAGRRVQRRGRFISEVTGNESVRVPIGNTSAPLLWSVLCLLSCRNKKVRPPAGSKPFQSQQANRNSTLQGNSDKASQEAYSEVRTSCTGKLRAACPTINLCVYIWRFPIL